MSCSFFSLHSGDKKPVLPSCRNGYSPKPGEKCQSQVSFEPCPFVADDIRRRFDVDCSKLKGFIADADMQLSTTSWTSPKKIGWKASSSARLANTFIWCVLFHRNSITFFIALHPRDSLEGLNSPIYLRHFAQSVTWHSPGTLKLEHFFCSSLMRTTRCTSLRTSTYSPPRATSCR
jgi:hypothetical protein